MKVLTPLEFYQQTFPEDAKIILELKDHALFSLNSMVQFTELYTNYINDIRNI